MPHILFLPANTKRHDLIITDVHARLERLIELDKLSSVGDRIFGGGDWLDRGTQNVEVIEKILAMKAAGKEVYSILGNHEKYFLETVARMEQLIVNMLEFLKKPEAAEIDVIDYKNTTILNDAIIASHIKNGGKWLVELYHQEIQQGLILITDSGVKYNPASKINMVTKYFKTLPCIIRVQGKEDIGSFNIAHGDLPFNDEALLEKIEKKIELTEAETEYTLEARKVNFKNNKRTATSTLTYCGHNIFGRHFDAVRPDVNAMSIDGGPLAVYVNHTTKTIFLLRTDPAELTAERLKNIEMIQSHLTVHKKYETVMSRLNSCQDIEDVHNCIDEVIKASIGSIPYENCVRFMINEKRLQKFGIKSTSDYYQIIFQSNKDTMKCSGKRSQYFLDTPSVPVTPKSTENPEAVDEKISDELRWKKYKPGSDE